MPNCEIGFVVLQTPISSTYMFLPVLRAEVQSQWRVTLSVRSPNVYTLNSSHKVRLKGSWTPLSMCEEYCLLDLVPFHCSFYGRSATLNMLLMYVKCLARLHKVRWEKTSDLVVWRKTDTLIAYHNPVCEGWHNLQQGLCVITPNIFASTALGSTLGWRKNSIRDTTGLDNDLRFEWLEDLWLCSFKVQMDHQWLLRPL